MNGRKRSFVGLLEVLELLAGELLVPAEVEVAAVVDPLDLLPAEGELVLDVERGAGVVRQLVGAVLVPAQPRRARGRASWCHCHPPLPPVLEPLRVGARLDEELHLHLLELARPEDEVARRDLVAERLADLRDAERNLLPGRSAARSGS